MERKSMPTDMAYMTLHRLDAFPRALVQTAAADAKLLESGKDVIILMMKIVMMRMERRRKAGPRQEWQR